MSDALAPATPPRGPELTPSASPSSSDVTASLTALRGELHVNELRHSGTRDGNIYSRWGSAVAFALIEIETLRAALRASVENIYWMSAASDFGPDGQARDGWVKVREETRKHDALLKAEGVAPVSPEARSAGGTP